MEHWKVYREKKSLAGVNQRNNRLNCTLLRALPEMTEITGLPINSSIKVVHLCELLSASQTASFFFSQKSCTTLSCQKYTVSTLKFKTLAKNLVIICHYEHGEWSMKGCF